MAFTQPRFCPVIIGRAQEQARCAGLLDEAAAGRGTFLLISGEAGIGKSRLLRDLMARASRAGFQSLLGVCQEHDRDYPFAPFLDAFRQHLHNVSPAESGALIGPDRVVFARLLPELGLGDGAPAAPLPPEQEKRGIFEAFVGLLARMARGGPLLFSLEDLHWADETSLELLQLLPRRLAAAPVLLAGTARSDEPGSALGYCLTYLERNRLITRLNLTSLTEAETAQMIEATLDASVPAAIVDAVHQRAEGNPFLTEELLHALTAEAGGRSRVRAWGATAGLDIPTSVLEAVTRRLNSLDPSVRRVIEFAAVVGRRFSFDLLRDLSGLDDRALIDALRQLISDQLIIEERSGGAAVFAFRHALTRDAVYHALLGPERRQLHQTAARVLGRTDTAWEPLSAGELGYHYEAAEDWERARICATEAGDAARALFANAEALSHYRRALRSARRVGPSGARAAMILAHKCGQVLAVLGEFEAALAHFEEALADARRLSDPTTEQHVLTDLAGHYASRDYDAAYRYGRQAVEFARMIGEERDQALALNRLANIIVNQMRFTEGFALHEEALGIFERLNDPWGVADSLDYLGMIHYLSGDIPEARERFSRALTIFEGIGDRERIASCLANRSPYYPVLDGACPGDVPPEASLADAERAVGLCREIGWAAGETYARVAVASARIGVGEYGAGLKELIAAEAMAAQIDHAQWGIIARLAHGIALAQLSDMVGAMTVLNEAHAAAQAMGAVQFVAQSASCLAACLVACGDLDAAESALRPLMPEKERPHTIAARRALLASAHLALRRGDPARTLAETRRLMLPPYATQPLRPTPAVLLLRAEAFAASERPDEAHEALAAAHTLTAERGPRGLLWRISATHAVLNRRMGGADRSALARARGELNSLARSLGDLPVRDTLLATPLAQQVLATPERTSAPNQLTRRERQIVAQIARGKSNRQIAGALFIAEKTVEMHVSNSLSKLGFHARSQLAAWAAGQASLSDPPDDNR